MQILRTLKDKYNSERKTSSLLARRSRLLIGELFKFQNFDGNLQDSWLNVIGAFRRAEIKLKCRSVRHLQKIKHYFTLKFSRLVKIRFYRWTKPISGTTHNSTHIAHMGKKVYLLCVAKIYFSQGIEKKNSLQWQQEKLPICNQALETCRVSYRSVYQYELSNTPHTRP